MISNNDTMYDDEIPDNIQPELNAKLNHRNCFAFSNTDGGNGLMDDDDSHVFADDDDDDDDYNSNAIYRICSSDVCKSNNRHRQQNCGLQRSSIEEYVDRTFNHNEHQSTNAFDNINDNDYDYDNGNGKNDLIHQYQLQRQKAMTINETFIQRHWNYFNSQQQQQQQQQLFTIAKLPSNNNNTNLSRLNFVGLTMTNNSNNASHVHEKKNYHRQNNDSNKNADVAVVVVSNGNSHNRDNNDFHHDHIEYDKEPRVVSDFPASTIDIDHSDNNNHRDSFNHNTMNDDNESCCHVLSNSHQINSTNPTNRVIVDDVVDNQENDPNLFNLQKIDQLRPKLITMNLNNNNNYNENIYNNDDSNRVWNYSSNNNVVNLARKCGTEFMMMMSTNNIASIQQNNNNNADDDFMNNGASSSICKKPILHSIQQPNDNGNRFYDSNYSLLSKLSGDKIANTSMDRVLLSSSPSSSSTTIKTLANKSSVTRTHDRSTSTILSAWHQRQQNSYDGNICNKIESSDNIMNGTKNGHYHFGQNDNSINYSKQGMCCL